MKDNKVDVIISQTRYEELLKKEQSLKEIQEDHFVYIGYKYLDLKSAKSVLMSNDKDVISFEYKTGNNIPQEVKNFIENKNKEILERLDYLNEVREYKIEGAKHFLTSQIEERYKQGFKPDWTLLEWLGIKWDELRGKKK